MVLHSMKFTPVSFLFWLEIIIFGSDFSNFTVVLLVVIKEKILSWKKPKSQFFEEVSVVDSSGTSHRSVYLLLIESFHLETSSSY